MIDLNYKHKLRHCESLMSIWSSRNLTPLGRNTVFKSLILPKLNNLFASLPNPPEELIEDFQGKCFRFVWGNKPDKIKRDQLICTVKDGDLNAPNIKEIMQAQKISVIRRFYINHTK